MSKATPTRPAASTRQKAATAARRLTSDQDWRYFVMQGPKTHQQQVRILERKAGASARPNKQTGKETAAAASRIAKPAIRATEFPVSRTGMRQESDHNKHNLHTQSGHKPQKQSPAQEKH